MLPQLTELRSQRQQTKRDKIQEEVSEGTSPVAETSTLNERQDDVLEAEKTQRHEKVSKTCDSKRPVQSQTRTERLTKVLMTTRIAK